MPLCHHLANNQTWLIFWRRQCRSRGQVWFLHSRTSPWTWRPLRESLLHYQALCRKHWLELCLKWIVVFTASHLGHWPSFTRPEAVWVAPKASGFELVHSWQGFEESYNSLVRFRDAFCGSSAQQSAVAGVIFLWQTWQSLDVIDRGMICSIHGYGLI